MCESGTSITARDAVHWTATDFMSPGQDQHVRVSNETGSGTTGRARVKAAPRQIARASCPPAAGVYQPQRRRHRAGGRSHETRLSCSTARISAVLPHTKH